MQLKTVEIKPTFKNWTHEKWCQKNPHTNLTVFRTMQTFRETSLLWLPFDSKTWNYVYLWKNIQKIRIWHKKKSKYFFWHHPHTLSLGGSGVSKFFFWFFFDAIFGLDGYFFLSMTNFEFLSRRVISQKRFYETSANVEFDRHSNNAS